MKTGTIEESVSLMNNLCCYLYCSLYYQRLNLDMEIGQAFYMASIGKIKYFLFTFNSSVYINNQ